MTGRELKPQDRTVDVTIRRIRKHFEDHPNTPEIIATVHGEGYRFCGEIRKNNRSSSNKRLSQISLLFCYPRRDSVKSTPIYD